MKSKIYKILGVTLALVLVLSLFGAFLPTRQVEVEAQGYLPNQWNFYPTPVPGAPHKLCPVSDIWDMAVANDGKTIWIAIPNLPFPGSATQVMRSTSGGMMWSTMPTLGAATNFAGPAKLVAVAPDDPTVVAVVGGAASGTDGIWYTVSNGATWSYMGDIATNGAAGEIITGIAVGPARMGPLMGRDVAVCTSNINAATFGDIYLVPGALWAPAASVATLPLGLDYTSMALAPNWLGDRVVVAVGSDDGTVVPGGDANDVSGVPGDTFLVMLNVAPLDTSPPGAPQVVAPSPTRLESAFSESPPEMVLANWPAVAAPGGTIITSSLALPGDWDSTTSMGRRAWVAWTSVHPAAPAPPTYSDDAYRVDNSSVRKLEISAQVSINSLAYSGTITGGTLFAGERVGAVAGAPAMIWYTDDPQSAIPTWSYTFKPPTGALGNGNDTILGTFDDPSIVVGVAPDFASSLTVYAATNDGNAAGQTVANGGFGPPLFVPAAGIMDDSAFSRSTNGGLSFNGYSAIDEAVLVLDDIMPVPDGSTLFMASDDGAAAPSPNCSLWMSEAVPPDTNTWERVRFKPANSANAFGSGASQIRISPEWDDDASLYWFDTFGAAPGRIERSVDGSDIFATRSSPAAIGDATVENKDVLYVSDAGTGLVRRSTNGAWFFDLPIGAAIAAVNNMNMLPSYPEKPVPGNLVAGGILGGVCISLDGGQGWIPLGPGVPAGLAQVVIGDKDWANNSTVYAGDAAGTGIWRFQFGASTAWESINNLIGGLRGPDNLAGTGDDIVVPIPITGLAMSSGILYGSWASAPATPPPALYSGAQRSLVPSIPVIANWLFQSMDVGSGATTFNTAPSALRAADLETAVHLWTIDTTGNVLFGYEDTMAKVSPDMSVPDVVPIDSVTGRNTQFVVSWPQLSNATNFQIEIYSDPACTQLVTWAGLPAAAPVSWAVPDPLGPAWVVLAATPGLMAGQEYFIKARGTNQMPTDAINSPWSSVFRFTVQAGERVEVSYLGVQPIGPICGSTDAPASPGFTWSPYGGATRYEFQLANDANFADIIEEAKVSATGYKYEGTLSEGTTCFWRARGIEPTATDWSPVCSFTVAKSPPPPVVIEPTPPAPPAPAPIVSGVMIWAIVGIGVVLVIAVIVLIVRTRRAV